MAKATETKSVINRRKAEDNPGKYDQDVRDLIAADADLTPEDIANGEFNTVTITVPKETPEGKDLTARHKRYFQDSAKAHDRTAREVDSTDTGDGYVSIEFRLVPKVLRPRKATTDENTESATEEAVAAA